MFSAFKTTGGIAGEQSSRTGLPVRAYHGGLINKGYSQMRRNCLGQK
jgi:hypothetical protein